MTAAPTSAGPVALVGREALLATVDELVAADVPVVLVGAGGVGKTAVLEHAARAAARPVHRGGGLELLRDSRYAAFARALPGADLTGDTEAVAAVVAAAVGPDLLVVDDLHLCDAGTLAVLVALAGRVAVLAASRDEPPTDPDLLRGHGFEVLGVAPLARRDAARVALASNPGLTGPELEDVLARAGGLPLLLADLAAGTLEPSVARGLVPRRDGLGDAARDLALRVALAGSVPVPEAGSSEALDGAVEEVVARGLASLDDGVLSVRHALVADAVVAGTDPREVRAARLGLAAEAHDPGVRARHLAAAGQRTQARRVALDAAAAATSVDDRAHLLALVAELSEGQDRLTAVVGAAQALLDGVHCERALALVDLLAPDEPVPVDDAAKAVWLRLQAVGALSALRAGRFRDGLARARAGLAVVDADRGLEDRAPEAVQDLLLAVTRAEFFGGETAPAALTRFVDRADALAARTGRHARVSEARGLVAAADGLDRAAAHWLRAVDEATAEDDVLTLVVAGANYALTLEATGPASDALGTNRRFRALTAARGLGRWSTEFLLAEAAAAFHLGRFADALALWDDVDLVAATRDVRRNLHVAKAHMFPGLGLVDEAQRQLRLAYEVVTDDQLQASPLAVNTPTLVYCRALVAETSGRPEEVVSIVGEYLAAVADGPTHMSLRSIEARARAELGLAVTAVDPADHAPGLFRGEAHQVNGFALLARAPLEAAAAFDAAVEELRDSDFMAWLGARWDAAEARRRGGDPSARALLEEVEADAERAGLVVVLGRARRSLRLLGLRRAAPRALDASGLVTVREREVLDLVGEGLTVAQIARRLAVGRPTVNRLLGNARAKLGASDRIHALALLHAGGGPA